MGIVHRRDVRYRHVLQGNEGRWEGDRRSVDPRRDCAAGDRRQNTVHAPAWGATEPLSAKAIAVEAFNPRTRVGCDDAISALTDSVTLFQSTHPRGVRLYTTHHPAWDANFQSTHPRGVRRESIVGFAFLHAFNPRTRVGCDVAAVRPLLPRIWAFNPRTRVGCDEITLNNTILLVCLSIHAPAWGATSSLNSTA